MITINKIRKTIIQVLLKRVSRGDAIFNLILKKILKSLLPYLYRIFNIYITNNYYLEYFRISIIIILPKPSKNYSISKGYRLIALLNIIEKAIKFILIRRIAYLVKIYELLSTIYIRGYRLRLYKYDIYYLLERIYQIQNSNKVATMLLLDVLDIYNKISYPRLLYNLRKRKIDIRVVNQIESFLFNRIIILKTSEYSILKTSIVIKIP